jgi:hypothetical protein
MNERQRGVLGESKQGKADEQELLDSLLQRLGHGAEGPPLTDHDLVLLKTYSRCAIAAHTPDEPIELTAEQILAIQSKILKYRAWALAYAEVCRAGH